EGDLHRLARPGPHDPERGTTAVVPAPDVRHQVAGPGDLVEQFTHLRPLRGGVQGAHQIDRLAQVGQDRPALLERCRVQHEILPTGSNDGARVSSPASHLAGQTAPGWLRTYGAAFTLRTSSAALRPIPSAVISKNCTTPSGSTRKVPRLARPSSSRSA